MALYNRGYRLGNSPFKSGLGALTTIYNGQGSLFRGGPTTSSMRSSAWLFGEYHGYPTGNLHPKCWMLPQKAGAMSMRTVGQGAMTAGLLPSYPMSIDMTGSGDLEATAGLVVSMLLAMSGSGTLTANIYGYMNMSCDLEGSGDMTADMEGIASMAIALLGTGDLEATIAAYGNMEIDIVVTGTGLTTSNVGDAVWQYIIGSSEAQDLLAAAGAAADPLLGVVEGTLTLRDVQRIVLAVLAGQVTGAGSGTETFKGQAGENRVVSTVDNDGNRSSVTLDAT